MINSSLKNSNKYLTRLKGNWNPILNLFFSLNELSLFKIILNADSFPLEFWKVKSRIFFLLEILFQNGDFFIKLSGQLSYHFQSNFH